MMNSVQINLDELNEGVISISVSSECEHVIVEFGKYLKTKWPELKIILYKKIGESTYIKEI